jgi:hypothetical protein
VTEDDYAYHFDSIEEMQSYVQKEGPLRDGKMIFVGEMRIR